MSGCEEDGVGGVSNVNQQNKPGQYQAYITQVVRGWNHSLYIVPVHAVSVVAGSEPVPWPVPTAPA